MRSAIIYEVKPILLVRTNSHFYRRPSHIGSNPPGINFVGDHYLCNTNRLLSALSYCRSLPSVWLSQTHSVIPLWSQLIALQAGFFAQCIEHSVQVMLRESAKCWNVAQIVTFHGVFPAG